MSHGTRTFYALYVAIVGVALVAALEIASHVVLEAKGQTSDAFANGRHLYHPYRTHQLNPDYVREFDTGGVRLHSADGFRSDRPFEKDKPDGVFRIVMLGGSTLYGIGAEPPYPRTPSLRNDETVSHFVETGLNAALTEEEGIARVEVINAGVVAYTTFHHLVYVNEVLYEYEPDLLVFLDGHNDFYYYTPYNQWQAYELGTSRLTEHVNERSPWFAGLSAVRYLARFSRFFLVVERYLESRWQEARGPRFLQASTPRAAYGATDTERALEESVVKSYVQLQRLGELFDYDTVVFLQPEIVHEDPALLSEPDRALRELTLELDENNGRARARETFPALFGTHDIDYVDVGEIASETTRDVQLYVDYCHLTPSGARTVAERLLPELERRLRARASELPG